MPPAPEPVNRADDGQFHLVGTVPPGQRIELDLTRLDGQLTGLLDRSGTSTLHVWGTASGTALQWNADDTIAPIYDASGTWSNDGQAFDGVIRYRDQSPVPLHLVASVPSTANGQAIFKMVRAKGTYGVVPGKPAEGSPLPACEASIAYPEVVSVADASPDALAKVNRRLRELAIASSTTAEAAVSEFIQDCREEVELGDEGMSSYGWSEHMTYAVTLNRQQVLSVLFSFDTYTGGAHPNYAQFGAVFDLQTGNQLMPEDLVDAQTMPEFMKREHRLVLADASDRMFDEAREEYQGFVDGTVSDSRLGDFYLTSDAYVTLYNAYDLTPYVGGPIEVDVPYLAWQDLMAPSAPVKRLLTH